MHKIIFLILIILMMPILCFAEEKDVYQEEVKRYSKTVYVMPFYTSPPRYYRGTHRECRPRYYNSSYQGYRTYYRDSRYSYRGYRTYYRGSKKRGYRK